MPHGRGGLQRTLSPSKKWAAAAGPQGAGAFKGEGSTEDDRRGHRFLWGFQFKRQGVATCRRATKEEGQQEGLDVWPKGGKWP